jgi:hypothetical protein
MNEYPKIVSQAAFACSICGKEAGQVQLFGTPSNADIRRVCFTSTLDVPVPEKTYEKLQEAIRQKSPQGLYNLNFEYAPFFCPQCNACYCGGHWNRRDMFDSNFSAWHDSIRGKCPQGHERILEN